VKAAIAAGEAELNRQGPAADPQVRHRAADPRHGEGEDEALVARVVADIVKAVEAAAA
jgi:hypothetical protein